MNHSLAFILLPESASLHVQEVSIQFYCSMLSFAYASGSDLFLSFQGIRPAWGAYIRHAKNVEFRNVQMRFRSEDERQKIVMDDVQGFVER